MHAFWAELTGTALLIVLGDGVVAGVLLRHSKSENAGWIVITIGWALAVTLAVYSARSEEHTAELQARSYLVCRLRLKK